MRRWLIGIVVIVIIGACAAIALLGRAPSAAGAGGPAFFGRPNQVNLKTVRIDKGDLQSIVTATGSVVANGQSALSFDFPGTVVEMPVQEGQHVTAGQLLAREDDTSQQLNVQQTNFAVQAAQAALDKLLEPVDARDVANAQATVKAAEGNYMSLQGSVSPSQLKAAQLGVQQAQAAAQNATLLPMGA